MRRLRKDASRLIQNWSSKVHLWFRTLYTIFTRGGRARVYRRDSMVVVWPAARHAVQGWRQRIVRRCLLGTRRPLLKRANVAFVTTLYPHDNKRLINYLLNHICGYSLRSYVPLRRLRTIETHGWTHSLSREASPPLVTHGSVYSRHRGSCFARRTLTA